MDIILSKKELRKEVKSLKLQITSKQKLVSSAIIFEKIENIEIFQKAKTILLYWSLDDEVATHNHVKKWSTQKKVLLPVIDKDELVIREFTDEGLMKESLRFGIKEPIGENFVQLEQIDLVVVPGIAFDKNNNRLGRGKGYYDKLLPKLISAYKIGVCYRLQLLEEIPFDEKDVKMDFVVTD